MISFTLFCILFFLQFFYNCLHIKRDDLSRYSNLSRNLFYLLVEKEINVSRKGKSKSSILDGKWESLTSFNGNMVIEVPLSAEQKCKSLSRVYYRVPLPFIFPRKMISISNDRVTSSLKYFSFNGKKRRTLWKNSIQLLFHGIIIRSSHLLSQIFLFQWKKKEELCGKNSIQLFHGIIIIKEILFHPPTTMEIVQRTLIVSKPD